MERGASGVGFCTERNGFGLGDTRSVEVRAGQQEDPGRVDESQAKAALGGCSNAEVKPS